MWVALLCIRGAIHVNGTSLSAFAKLQKISFIAINLLLCFLSVEWFVALRPMVKAYHQLINSSTHKLTHSSTYRLTNSPTHQLINSPTRQLTNSSTHQLTNSPTRQLTNSPTHQLTNSSTHQLTNHQLTNSSTHQLKLLFLFYNTALILTPF